MLISFTFSF